MADGEKTLARRLYLRLRRDELLTADRNFYAFDAWGLAAGSGAALLWRAPTGLGLPVVRVLPDGTYLSVLINPAIRGARRRATILAAAGAVADGEAGAELDPATAHLVRVVEYDVPDREGNARRRADRAAEHGPRSGSGACRRARHRVSPAVGCDTKSRMLSERAHWRPVMPDA